MTRICNPPDIASVNDVLSLVFRELRPDSAGYARCEVTTPWGLSLPAEDGLRFHYVVEGEGRLILDHDDFVMEAGDVALLPHGTGHSIKDSGAVPTERLEELGFEGSQEEFGRFRAGGGGTHSVIICCTVRFSDPAAVALIRALPRTMLFKDAARSDPAVATLLTLLAEEAASSRIGSATVCARLADTIIVRLIRGWIEHRSDELPGWLAAIRDPKIGRAVAAIHRNPQEHWTAGRLAEIAGLSRTVFVLRFSTLVGRAPASYLLAWRMVLARALLQKKDLTIGEIARKLGYDAETSFSRAFKREVGRSPSEVRRNP